MVAFAFLYARDLYLTPVILNIKILHTHTQNAYLSSHYNYNCHWTLLVLSLQLHLSPSNYLLLLSCTPTVFVHFQLLFIQSPKPSLFIVTPILLITATPLIFDFCYVIFDYATLTVPFIATLPNNHCLPLLQSSLSLIYYSSIVGRDINELLNNLSYKLTIVLALNCFSIIFHCHHVQLGCFHL